MKKQEILSWLWGALTMVCWFCAFIRMDGVGLYPNLFLIPAVLSSLTFLSFVIATWNE